MTVARRLKQLAKWGIERTPGLNRLLLASAGYAVLTRDEAESLNREMISGWHSERSVRRQERAYDRLLAELRAGRPRVDLSVGAQAIAATGIIAPSLLEVGCGNGYYSEVFELLLHAVAYTGVDYSAAMVASARRRYRDRNFYIGDATKLQFGDSEFDIVFNGVSLMHILAYEAAIRESSRVARSHVVFHSVPIFDSHDSVYLRKYAYGGPVVEMIFDRRALENVFAKEGLAVVETWPATPYDVAAVVGTHSYGLTYLCEKRR